MKRILTLLIALIMAQAVMAQQDKPAYTILQTLMQQYDVPFTQENIDEAEWGDDDSEGLYCHFGAEPVNYLLHCFPHKNGGYMAILLAEDLSTFEFRNYAFYYKDGEMTNPTDVLPYPTMEDYYSNADQFPKPAYFALSTVVEYPIYNYDRAKKQLQVTFMLLLSENDFVKKYMKARKAMIGPQITYTWDGEQFVRTPDNKPFDEDLSIFGVEGYVAKNPENIAVEAIKAYFATDPFQLGLSQKEYLDKFDGRIMKISRNDATAGLTFTNENGMITSYHVEFACYEHKKGGYIAVCYQDKDKKLAMYSFKDGNLTLLSNAFPPLNKDNIEKQTPTEITLAVGFYIYPFTADGFQGKKKNIEYDQETFKMIDHGDTITEYKWDGEKFIRQ